MQVVELKENPNYLFFSDGRMWSKIYKKFLQPLMVKRSSQQKFAGGSPTYPRYLISVKGVRKMLAIHRLLGKYFIKNPNPKEFNCVLHLDDDPFNLKLNNLRWGNQKINMKMYADRRYGTKESANERTL